MWTLDQLDEHATAAGSAGLDELLLPLDAGLQALPALDVSAEQALQLRQGRRFIVAGAVARPLCRARGPDGRLVALVEIDPAGAVRVRRGFNAVA
jgi:tRNA pseudouridine55 synthase